jgi:uncharacterized protein (TIGR02246 family)
VIRTDYSILYAMDTGVSLMSEVKRPTLSLNLSPEPVHAFVQQLQDAIDTGNADLFNLNFAEDVLWGSPFGAVAVGYEQIHAIHSRMFASVVAVKGASRYQVEHVRFLSENIAIAYVRRVTPNRENVIDQSRPGAFDELALLVLVQREGKWWLAAAQHVPDRRDVYSTSNTK